ncbi:hypothetical protein [Schleiferilactobacillus shenzhenensis]|uniref:Uncharacterized protein n=1 Tax=Schleiferilactobacillus shenzhenensis LY-73 TaxID=1231336 RepID=U4TWN9_9LACO|nr:hypothetical protein [Schleiferilactobacillus shenzhenensis]ERL65792.1 hypothetical protein L248_1868 [Schleiferilactobacillus shenzhenensis LY-73]
MKKIEKKDIVFGSEYWQRMRSLPHFNQARQIIPAMIRHGLSGDEVLSFTGLTEHEFAAMLAGDGAYTDADYQALMAQIKAHGDEPVRKND